MSLLSRPGLVLLEIAISAGLVAYAFRGIWLPIGATVAVLCLLLALVPLRGRPLRQVIWAWFSMRSRSSRLNGPGIAALAGDEYEVVAVPTAGAVGIGAIRDATTWSVPLALPLSRVFNDDAPIPLDRLATLLMVEEVPLASVRLVTMTAPATNASGPPTGPVPPAPRLATRHLVLTLDTLHAADAIAGRGGEPGIHQILRRCVMRAEEVLTSAGVEVRRLPDRVVAMDSASSLGPLSSSADGPTHRAQESLTDVRLQEVVSITHVVTGPDALTKVDQLAALLPIPIVATSVVLEPDPRNRTPRLTLLLRMSGSAQAIRSASTVLTRASRDLGLKLHPVPGEQLPMLKATTLLGVARAA